MNRRALFGGLVTALCAPVIIRTPGLLMPVRRVPVGDGVALFAASHPVEIAVLVEDLDIDPNSVTICVYDDEAPLDASRWYTIRDLLRGDRSYPHD